MSDTTSLPGWRVKLTLVVPCYNESTRWDEKYWRSLIVELGISPVFVDDGSTDDGSLIVNQGGQYFDQYTNVYPMIQRSENGYVPPFVNASWSDSTGVALIALMAAQLFVGNFLEPRLVGNSVNLSGFMVLFSLTIWTAMWGLAGTILAIPLTAVVMIILSQIHSTRPLAILMSESGELD